MSISKKLMTTGATGDTFVEDVFSTYLYEGDDGTDRDIVNGIDLDGEGGLVWIRNRITERDHVLVDTERGIAGGYLASNNEALPSKDPNNVRAFNSDGFRVGEREEVNRTGSDYASWTFRKAPSFFDVITTTISSGPSPAFTATSTGTLNPDGTITMPHSLKCIPGMIWMKVTEGTTGKWWVHHKDVSGKLILNEAGAASPTANLDNLTDTSFDIVNSGFMGQNTANHTFVIYVFAHDDSEEGMIQCGTYTGTGAAGNEIDLGWEPQWVLQKASDTGNAWTIIDVMRGANGQAAVSLAPNSSASEQTVGQYNPAAIQVTATGFKLMTDDEGGGNGNGSNYIYMAIRRPNKPASEFEADELFAVDSRGTGNPPPIYRSGFVVDTQIQVGNISGSYARTVWDRLRGHTSMIRTDDSGAEESGGGGLYRQDQMEGIGSGAVAESSSDLSWMWRRAPGFFDVVTYKGDGQAGREVPHNLGVAPEMIWVKSRDIAGYWQVYSKATGNTHRMHLNSDGQKQVTDRWANTDPTSDVFTVGLTQDVNANANDYIAYLFASVPGVCDIGSYTGTGGNQQIDCGFTNGARFVLIKSTDASGDWMVFDTVRGISDDASPKLKLNETAAQASGGFIRPYSGGFMVTANIDAADNRGEYIYMAIA